LAGFPHLPRDAMFRSVEGYPSGETPVNEAPIVLLSRAIECIWAATAREI